jgi:hypothetical protein
MEENKTPRGDEMYCWRCGSLIPRHADFCSKCGVRVSETQVREARRKGGPGWVIAGGILGIIAGVFALGFGIGMTVDGADDYWGHPNWAEIGFGISFLVTGALAIIGSSFAIARKNFGMALTGGICALWPMWFLGVAAIILIAISNDQFETSG